MKAFYLSARQIVLFIFTVTIVLLLSVVTGLYFPEQFSNLIKSIMNWQDLVPTNFSSLSTIFLSIIIEALPFILIGSFVSALIQGFVSEETIRRILPRNRVASLVLACLLGIVFPLCECGIIPIARRLIAKGVPFYAGIAFMLAVPIINPVVFLSTAFAFNGFQIAFLRAIIGFIVAFSVGLLLSFIQKATPLKGQHDHGGGACCGHSHSLTPQKKGFFGKIHETLLHTSDEFFDMGKYLIFGAFLAASMQTFVARSAILDIGQGNISSVAAMMVLAFVMSICSEADAFVAASFKANFTIGSILAFLIYGPMIDIKNTLMLLSTFKFRFAIVLIILVTVTVFAGAYFLNLPF